MKLDIGELYQKVLRRFSLHVDRICLTVTLHEDLHAFLSVPR
jgi:hypothetical protein